MDEHIAPSPAEWPSGTRMLLVEDDDVLRERLARAFRERGFAVDTAASRAQAAGQLGKTPELAVIDLRLPDGSGLELLEPLREANPRAMAVVLTGWGSIATAVDAIRLGAVNYLPKPADAEDILAAFRRGAEPPLALTPPDHEPPSLDRAEWEHIQRVLTECGGNISLAARRLGLHRRSLQRKLQKHPPSR